MDKLVPESNCYGKRIESIIPAINGVMIKRIDQKQLKIKFYLIERKQKELLYGSFTDYA